MAIEVRIPTILRSYTGGAKAVESSGATLDELGLSDDRANEYSNSGGPDLDDLLVLAQIPRDIAALDLGCGKGGALLTLAGHFTRVAGLDLNPELLATASRNLRKSHVTAQLIQADAAEFLDYDPYGAVYMYNPFPGCVMEAAAANIALSVRRTPRPFWLIYKNPLHHESLTGAGFRASGEFPCGKHYARIYQPG